MDKKSKKIATRVMAIVLALLTIASIVVPVLNH